VVDTFQRLQDWVSPQRPWIGCYINRLSTFATRAIAEGLTRTVLSNARGPWTNHLLSLNGDLTGPSSEEEDPRSGKSCARDRARSHRTDRRTLRGRKAGQWRFRRIAPTLTPDALRVRARRVARADFDLERAVVAAPSHGGGNQLCHQSMDGAERFLLRWRGAHRQQCFGKRDEAPGVEPQELVIRGQPPRRQNRGHPVQPNLNLPPTGCRPATVSHAVPHQPFHGKSCVREIRLHPSPQRLNEGPQPRHLAPVLSASLVYHVTQPAVGPRGLPPL